MFRRLKLYFLQKLYRVLVFKVYTVDRNVMSHYKKYLTFCDLSFETNQGRFNFSFKEYRRSNPRDSLTLKRTLSSYLVELECPTLPNHSDCPLHDKVIVVVMIQTKRVNYEALARVLLDLYIDQFPMK